MTDGERITATTDGYVMALKLIERVEGLKQLYDDERLRNALRDIVEGRFTLISDDIIRRAKGSYLIERFIADERKQASLILEGLEVLDQ